MEITSGQRRSSKETLGIAGATFYEPSYHTTSNSEHNRKQNFIIWQTYRPIHGIFVFVYIFV